MGTGFADSFAISPEVIIVWQVEFEICNLIGKPGFRGDVNIMGWKNDSIWEGGSARVR